MLRSNVRVRIEAQVRRVTQGLPLEWQRTSEVLPIQHIIAFRRVP